jgi:hypothetical protein
MRRTIGVVVLFGLLVSGAPAASAGTSQQRLGIPAYWTADAAGVARFDALVDAAPTVGMVVINGPTSSAPVPYDPVVAAQIRKLYHAGITVLGYVDTGYLGRTGMVTTRVNPGSTAVADWRAQAERDAAEWFALYGRHGLDGIFFDQALSACGPDDADVDVYHAIADALRVHEPDAFVALNPGTSAEECYAEVADALVIFENTYAEYLTWTPPTWVHRHRSRQFWHLVHGAATEAEMRSAVALSQQRRAGFVYVTDDTIDETGSPWDTLPPYWRAELREVRC